MNYKFDSRDEYTEWCVRMVQDIGLAAIMVDNEKIRDIVEEIQTTHHCSEGVELWKDDSE